MTTELDRKCPDCGEAYFYGFVFRAGCVPHCRNHCEDRLDAVGYLERMHPKIAERCRDLGPGAAEICADILRGLTK